MTDSTHSAGRPRWQQTQCPPWCASEHLEDDHPDDRVHRSAGMSRSITTRWPRFSGTSMIADVQEVDVEVGLKQIDGSEQAWLYVGAGPGRALELDVSQAANLLDLIRDAIDQAQR